MKTLGAIGAVFPIVVIAVLVAMSAYTVETGNVAVERTLGKVNHEEMLQGLNFKLPFLTNRIEFSAKEIAIDINDLTPKAADNLSLKDLDVSVFYRVPQDRISELMVKYAATAERGRDGIFLPAFGLVWREARSSIYEQVSEIDSLQLLNRREFLQTAVLEELQARLERTDPGDIVITRVVVRALNTDPSIEAAIRDAVEAEKRLEEEYLQHEVNTELLEFANNEGSVVVIPANMQGFDLILDSNQLGRRPQ